MSSHETYALLSESSRIQYNHKSSNGLILSCMKDDDQSLSLTTKSNDLLDTNSIGLLPILRWLYYKHLKKTTFYVQHLAIHSINCYIAIINKYDGIPSYLYLAKHVSLIMLYICQRYSYLRQLCLCFCFDSE